MPDRATITIPAPIARPGEAVEQLVRLQPDAKQAIWVRGTVDAARWRVTSSAYGTGSGWWEYEVMFSFGGSAWSVTRADGEIRRAEAGS